MGQPKIFAWNGLIVEEESSLDLKQGRISDWMTKRKFTWLMIMNDNGQILVIKSSPNTIHQTENKNNEDDDATFSHPVYLAREGIVRDPCFSDEQPGMTTQLMLTRKSKT